MILMKSLRTYQSPPLPQGFPFYIYFHIHKVSVFLFGFVNFLWVRVLLIVFRIKNISSPYALFRILYTSALCHVPYVLCSFVFITMVSIIVKLSLEHGRV